MGRDECDFEPKRVEVGGLVVAAAAAVPKRVVVLAAAAVAVPKRVAAVQKHFAREARQLELGGPVAAAPAQEPLYPGVSGPSVRSDARTRRRVRARMASRRLQHSPSPRGA